MVPFECDLCIFRKLRGTDPEANSSQDLLLGTCIRRMNLDAFWSRAKSTVYQNKRQLMNSLELSAMVGLQGSYEHAGPYKGGDQCGYEVAITILLYSLKKGKHDKTYTQFETIRKLRSVYSNHCRTMPQANQSHLSMVDSKGIYSRLSKDKCGALWFQRFMTGCQKRMGIIWKPNTALSIPLLLLLLEEAEKNIEEASTEDIENLWVCFTTYITISYVVSLRGSEGLLLDMNGLVKHWKRNDRTYFLIPLLGRIKGEEVERPHLIPCANTTSTLIKTKAVVRRLMHLKMKQGFVDGPAISDCQGRALSTSEFDDMMTEILEDIFDKNLSCSLLTSWEGKT